jgi:hypothetical protein
MLFAGGCGGGGGGDTPVVTPPPPTPRPEPQGNWQDEGNYDTGWYAVKPYEISTAKELAGLAKLVNDGNTFEGETISVTGNIDLGEHYWTPIGFYLQVQFSGTFNGYGFEIRNMIVKMEQSDNFLFSGFLGHNQGTIEDVHLTDVSVSGNNTGTSGGSWAGGFVGWNVGTITGCTVSGSVSAFNSNSYDALAGGFVGWNVGTITGCTADVTVSAYSTKNTSLAGGFVAYNEDNAKITDCTASGSVSSVSTVHNAYVGGFAAANYDNAKITRSAAKSDRITGTNGQAGKLYKGSFVGRNANMAADCLSDNSSVSVSGLYAIGEDVRKSPPGPSDDIQ